MSSLPPLPPHPLDTPWSPNVYQAYQIISDIFRAASEVLLQEADNIRLKLHTERLTGDVVPILVELENHAEDENISLEWLHSCTECIGALIVKLCEARETSRAHEDTNVGVVEPITIVHTGKPGRPRKVVDSDFLKEALSEKRRISLSKLADMMGIHRHTLRYYLPVNGVSNKFSSLSNHDLDLLVKTFRATKPDSGIRYLVGFLRRHGLRIQKRRVVASIHRVDGLGHVLHRRATIQRRKYNVSRPNYLWHIDGHHKLILWGFVIHGIVDGYCRTITGLRASTNNRASTVLDVFLEAIGKYGMPSRVRGDRGKENKSVSVYMILVKGLNRGSFIWGSSTHNTRIERLWVEVGTQFARQWRAFFYRLERLHGLDRKNPKHLWILHHLFLDMINDDCKTFQEDWNAHPLSGEGHDKSPNDMRFIGQVSHGIYVDDCAGVHPDVVSEYYGVHGPRRERGIGETGAGHFSDEDVPAVEPSMEMDEDDWDALEAGIEAAQASNFHHEAVDVPKHASPFAEEAHEVIFATALQRVRELGLIPSGYGLLPVEWDEESYPTFEIIKSGRRGLRKLRIALPDFIWRPRAELWGQALDIVDRLTYED